MGDGIKGLFNPISQGDETRDKRKGHIIKGLGIRDKREFRPNIQGIWDMGDGIKGF